MGRSNDEITSLGRSPADTSLPSLGVVVGATPHSTPHWLPFGITKCTRRVGSLKNSPHPSLIHVTDGYTSSKKGKHQGAGQSRGVTYRSHRLCSVKKWGAVNFFNFGNGKINVRSGCCSLVGSATIEWVHNFDLASKYVSDGYLNLAIDRELRPADHLTRHLV